MYKRVEKLSLLSEMISFAQKEEGIEYNFLLSVAQQLKISKLDFDYLIQHPIDYKHLKSHSERVIQFHRLVLLMNEDFILVTRKEVSKIYNFGIMMGLSHESITKVLYLMEGFPNNLVPADVLIDIFKVQYN